MADLKETTAAGLQVNRAASDAKDVVRKGEFDAALALRPTTTAMNTAINAVAHDACTVAQTDSVALSLTGQQISAEVTTSSSEPGLHTAGGLHVDFGTGASQVARGNHTHSNDHVPAVGGSSYTATVTVSEAQALTVDVTVDPAGNLESSAAGLKVTDNVFAAAAHTHDAATAATAGFMSASDKAKLDGLSPTLHNFVSTTTVTLTDDGGEVTADVIPGAGLKNTAGGVAVDYTQVPTYGHSHANATSTTPGFMSAAQVLALSGVNYIYLGWADLVSSSVPVNFSLTKDANKTCLAILTSTTAIAAPQASDFAGLWFTITPAT